MAHLRVWTAGGRAAPLSQKIEALLYPQTAKKQGLFPQFVQKQRNQAPVQTHRGLVYTPVVQRGNLMAACAAAYIARKFPVELFPFWKQFSSIKRYRTSAFGFWGIPGLSLQAVRIAAGAERNGPLHRIPS